MGQYRRNHQSNLFDIELVSVGVYTGVEDVTFKHHFRNISIRIVVRDHHLKSEHEDNQYSVTMRNMRKINVICGVQGLLINIIN